MLPTLPTTPPRTLRVVVVQAGSLKQFLLLIIIVGGGEKSFPLQLYKNCPGAQVPKHTKKSFTIKYLSVFVPLIFQEIIRQTIFWLRTHFFFIWTLYFKCELSNLFFRLSPSEILAFNVCMTNWKRIFRN